ncbi:hypothetical protein Purlil1_8248 [Purpureocillium lilacinum]|uniref:Uncharacterized protein n=1 Tax=Purpureocillium lilacinum TaxID=33203 RepID=A0ABR0BTQ2_PURLI|nr:hypothetical protein Purlil1_8248 [Purpureocillium lilacinum]
MLENVLMVSRGIKDWGGEAEERGRGRVRPRNGREGGRGGAMNGMGALSLGSPSGFCGHPGGWRDPGRSLPGQGRAPPASQTPSGPLERGAGRDGQGPAWAEQGSGGEVGGGRVSSSCRCSGRRSSAHSSCVRSVGSQAFSRCGKVIGSWAAGWGAAVDSVLARHQRSGASMCKDPPVCRLSLDATPFGAACLAATLGPPPQGPWHSGLVERWPGPRWLAAAAPPPPSPIPSSAPAEARHAHLTDTSGDDDALYPHLA